MVRLRLLDGRTSRDPTNHTDDRGRPHRASTGLAAFSGSAAAHWGEELDVDVKPGSGRNAINPRSRDVARVAVLTTDAFDPTEEEVRHRFGSLEGVENGGGAKPVRHRVEDVDGDGSDDLVSFFRTAEAVSVVTKRRPCSTGIATRGENTASRVATPSRPSAAVDGAKVLNRAHRVDRRLGGTHPPVRPLPVSSPTTDEQSRQS